VAGEISAGGKEVALRGCASNAASAGDPGTSPASAPQSERRDGIVEGTLGTWRIYVARTAPTEAELAALYDEAVERWHDQLTLLGYPRAYEDLFDRLLADGALNTLRNGGRVLDFGVVSDALLSPKWRHEHTTQHRLMVGMERAGLIGVRAYPLLVGGPLPRQASVAYVGFKKGVWQWSDT
jgi:hypothetical protein